MTLTLETVQLLTEAAPLGVAAHERLMEQRLQLDAVVGIVRDNTHALVALEDTQRQLQTTIRDAASRLIPTHNTPTDR